MKAQQKRRLETDAGSIDALIATIEAGANPIALSGLKGTAKFYLLSRIQAATGRPMLYVTAGEGNVDETLGDLTHFFPVAPLVLQRREVEKKTVVFSQSSSVTASRLRWFQEADNRPILLAPVQALLDKTIPPAALSGLAFEIRKGQAVSREELLENLFRMGYVSTDFVERVGEMAVRGSIIDLFPPGQDHPLRVETLGDEIYSLRHFSTQDQKSLKKIEAAAVIPVSEVAFDEESIERSIEYIRSKAAQLDATARERHGLIEMLQGKLEARLEYKSKIRNLEWLLPAFYEETGTAFDYLPENTLIVFDGLYDIDRAVKEARKSNEAMVDALRSDLKISPDLEELFISENGFEELISSYQTLHIEELQLADETKRRAQFQTLRLTPPAEGDYDSPFDFLEEEVGKWREEGYKVALAVHTSTEKKKIIKILEERSIEGLKDGIEVEVGPLSSGFVFPEEKIVVITERDILGEKKRARPPVSQAPSAFITSFSELKTGDYIVHRDVGIGIFRGLKRLKFGAKEGDFIECEYKDGDKIYVPVENLKLIQRYIGDGSKTPKIEKLGQQNWDRVVKRVKKVVLNIAKELVDLYARRKSEKGFRFSKNDSMYREFELSFPYEETPDQESAILDVMKDMESAKPMDRLICGDVGFGKTEVALRAAFKAVADGKQVAILVPTTLLAYQHYTTFLNRLGGYPVTVDMLSRFKPLKERKGVVARLAEGKLDIVIGTHMILSDKVVFKDLGLVVIDEEQRFGVTHKEKLRMMKKGVDVLTLSATPIPRTLQLSLTGIRDISLINTPPEGRQSVDVEVLQYNPATVREAIVLELKRGGGVFFVHNRIFDLFHYASLIEKLVPGARVEVTHGRMKETQLERSITRFMEGEADVLVTTAIVESGLDIPRANTMIINDAQLFGLADLYQLRGRVGRSKEKAQALFLVPSPSSITPEARKRLQALMELKELGSGFKLALSDLEIRGAGNMFGPEQSGQIADVGLEMYLEMLNKSITELKNEDGEQIVIEPEIKSHFENFIPDGYVEDGTERLLYYKRISQAETPSEIAALRDEIADRFGTPPPQAENIFQTAELRLTMKKQLITKIEITAKEAVILFHEKSGCFNMFKPSGKHTLYYESIENPGQALEKINELLGMDN